MDRTEYIIFILKILFILISLFTFTVKGVKASLKNVCDDDGTDSEDSDQNKYLDPNLVIAVVSIISLVGHYYMAKFKRFAAHQRVILFIQISLILFSLVIHILRNHTNFCDTDGQEDIDRLGKLIETLEVITFWGFATVILLISGFILYHNFQYAKLVLEQASEIIETILQRTKTRQQKMDITKEDMLSSLSWWMALFLSFEIILLIIAKYTNNLDYALLLIG